MKNMEKRKNLNIFEMVYDVVRKVPKGKVATYGQIACMMGNPGLSRVVGYAMSSCPYNDVPCHRIINRFGELAKNFSEGGNEIQKYLLEREGVKVNEEGRVDLKKYRWNGIHDL